jgi:hypothetical protein
MPKQQDFPTGMFFISRGRRTDVVSSALLVDPAVFRRRPPWCEVLFVVIDPVRRAGQEFGQPGLTTFPAIGVVLAMARRLFAATLGTVTGAEEDTRPKCRERTTGFAILVRRWARRDLARHCQSISSCGGERQVR